METNGDENTITTKTRGQWTAEVAERLKSEFQNVDIFYDHGSSSGRIVSYFGESNKRGTQLSYLDIAVVKKSTDQAIALIEIEETANRPKTIIADIFGFLLGERVVFGGRHLTVNDDTTLIIMGFSKTKYPEHTRYLLEKVGQAKAALDTNNSQIGKIVIEVYSCKAELFTRLKAWIDGAIKDQL